MSYQPKTSIPCGCKRGLQRDNCPECEGTGRRIDFAAVRARGSASRPPEPVTIKPTDPLGLLRWHVSGAIARGEGVAIVEVKPATRFAYIAEYPDPDTEVILFSDSWWSETLRLEFDRLAASRLPGSAPVQAWYSDPYQVTLMGSIRS